jgi:excisionase family DNA binding protein
MKMITAPEAAKILGVSPQQLRTLIRDGRVKASKWGRDWMVDADALKMVGERKKTGRPPGTKKAKKSAKH